MKKRVYVSHPYGGKEENMRDIEKVIMHLNKDERIYNTFSFLSPVHAFGFMYQMYEGENYYKGLQLCIDLFDVCDMMLMIGDWETSKGCVGEKAYCDEHNIPYIMVRTSDEILNTPYNRLYETLMSEVEHG